MMNEAESAEATAARSDSAPDEDRPASTPSGGTLTAEAVQAPILMVDDHPANLVALEAILEPLGQPLVKATSGEEALRQLLRDDFACILMDVQMPGMDGFQTAAIIKERPRTRHVPILFLTALSRDAAHVFKGYEQGAVDYLLKPFDPEILRSKVSVFVELFRKGELLKRQEALLRQREREALERKSEARFRALTDALPHCVWAARADGSLYYANRATETFAGPERREEFWSLVHPDEREALHETWQGALADQRAFEAECRLVRRDTGEPRWHLWRGMPELDDRGRLTGWIVTATDLTERKRAEDALRATNEAKDAFLAAASHELRTPLQAAKGHAHLALLKLGEKAEEGPVRALKIIMRQIDRMAKLVEDLLDVSRLQAGRLALEIDAFDVAALLRDVTERTQSLSQTHPLVLDVPDTLEISADRSRVEQVVVNLVSNAIRYSPEGGEVRISGRREDGHVHLAVSDRGVGIPPEKQAIIFERFGRAHGARYGGLGLGLTISQGIVEQHRGRIWVESPGELGEGSTFHVLLPLKPPPPDKRRDGGGRAQP